MSSIIDFNSINYEVKMIDELIISVEKLNEKLRETDENVINITFVSPSEFSKLYGCSLKIAQHIYSLPDFPSSDFGKEKKAEIHNVLEYFNKHIEKSKLKYWNVA